MTEKNLEFDLVGQKIVGHSRRGWVVDLTARLNAEIGASYHPDHLHHWRAGRRPVPPPVWAVMRLLAEKS